MHVVVASAGKKRLGAERHGRAKHQESQTIRTGSGPVVGMPFCRYSLSFVGGKQWKPLNTHRFSCCRGSEDASSPKLVFFGREDD